MIFQGVRTPCPPPLDPSMNDFKTSVPRLPWLAFRQGQRATCIKSILAYYKVKKSSSNWFIKTITWVQKSRIYLTFNGCYKTQTCPPKDVENRKVTILEKVRLFFTEKWSSITFEPQHEISNNVVCATSKGSDQPAHTRSLIRAFASRLNTLGLLSYWPNIIRSF